MKPFKIGISIRFKLLTMLVSLPLLSLSIYLVYASDLFKADKVAYVFETSATVSHSLATQLRMEAESAYGSLRGVVENFEISTSDFNATGKDLFEKNPRLLALIVFRRNEAGEYVKLGQLAKTQAPAQNFLANAGLIAKLREQALKNGAFVTETVESADAVAVSYRLGAANEANNLVMMGLYKATDLLATFQSQGVNYSSFVISRSGQIAIGAMEVVAGDLDILRTLLSSGNQTTGEGSAEARLSDGQTYLIGYADTRMGDLTVISKVDKHRALGAVQRLMRQSLAFFGILISITILISIFASNKLTDSLRELFEATKKIAQGEFNVRVRVQSNDEVGGLADSFNTMAEEVKRLMSATAEKARMESELSTVRTVQETLFPPAHSQFGPIHIHGHFEPASECGGDWWNYSRLDNKIFLWIGDATGHGAPAALITSAARSAAAVIESLPDVTPSKALTILNRAIHQTSKGQIMMTFFIACIDLDHNTFTYASASHDPPYLMRRKGEKISKKDLVPLNEVNGPRLGDQKDHVYADVTIEFEPGDLLFLYTDGILDVQDPSGKKWSERAFLKCLVDSANLTNGVDGKLENLRQQVDSFRAGSSLIDDVTMVMCEYEKRAA